MSPTSRPGRQTASDACATAPNRDPGAPSGKKTPICCEFFAAAVILILPSGRFRPIHGRTGSVDAMECIAIINQKGGVGKTSTAVNLGAALAQRGRRMLLIDLDPQGHLTTHFGLDGAARGAGIYEVLTRGLPLDRAIHAYSPTISIVPAQVDLAAAEVELVSVVGREVILRDHLGARERPYDFVVLDCPPSLGVLSLNALAAANRVLIPVQPHFLALQGTGKLFETISLVQQRLNARLTVAGMVICLHEAGTRLSGEVIDDLSRFLDSSRESPVPWRNARIFQTRIRRNVKLAESPSYGQSIFEYAPRSNGALDYLALADELLAYVEGRAYQPADEVPAPEAPIPAARAIPAAAAPPAESIRNERLEVPPEARVLPSEAVETIDLPIDSRGENGSHVTAMRDVDVPQGRVGDEHTFSDEAVEARPAAAVSHRRAKISPARAPKPRAPAKPRRVAPRRAGSAAPEGSGRPLRGADPPDPAITGKDGAPPAASAVGQGVQATQAEAAAEDR